MANWTSNMSLCAPLSCYMQYRASTTPRWTSQLLPLSMVSRNVLLVRNLYGKKSQIRQTFGQSCIDCISTRTRQNLSSNCCIPLPKASRPSSPLTTTNRQLNLRTTLHPRLASGPCKNRGKMLLGGEPKHQGNRSSSECNSIIFYLL